MVAGCCPIRVGRACSRSGAVLLSSRPASARTSTGPAIFSSISIQPSPLPRPRSSLASLIGEVVKFFHSIKLHRPRVEGRRPGATCYGLRLRTQAFRRQGGIRGERKSVGEGRSVGGRVYVGGQSRMKNKKK